MLNSGAIVGIGETKVGRFPGRTAVEMQCEAVRLAMADAGLAKSDLDSVYALSSYLQPNILHGLSIIEYLGLNATFQGNFDVGGTVAFMSMAFDALSAIANGSSEVAVCVYGDNASTQRAPGAHGFIRQATLGTEDFEDPFGASAISSYALLARRYLDLYGLEPEPTFWPVALAARTHGARNENAVYRKPITLDDYRASKMIAEPFRLLDSSRVVDGAGAFVIASKAAIGRRGLKQTPVSVLGIGTRTTHKIVSQAPDYPELGVAEAGRRAFAQAGVKPDDIDLMTVHDGFSHQVLVALEELGFCPRGEGGRFVAAGDIDLGGALPTNTHGGFMAQGHVGGILNVVEAVRQLRGDATGRQVEDAELAVVTGNGGIYSMCGTMVLGKGA